MPWFGLARSLPWLFVVTSFAGCSWDEPEVVVSLPHLRIGDSVTYRWWFEEKSGPGNETEPWISTLTLESFLDYRDEFFRDRRGILVRNELVNLDRKGHPYFIVDAASGRQVVQVKPFLQVGVWEANYGDTMFVGRAGWGFGASLASGRELREGESFSLGCDSYLGEVEVQYTVASAGQNAVEVTGESRGIALDNQGRVCTGFLVFGEGNPWPLEGETTRYLQDGDSQAALPQKWHFEQDSWRAGTGPEVLVQRELATPPTVATRPMGPDDFPGSELRWNSSYPWSDFYEWVKTGAPETSAFLKEHPDAILSDAMLEPGKISPCGPLNYPHDDDLVMDCFSQDATFTFSTLELDHWTAIELHQPNDPLGRPMEKSFYVLGTTENNNPPPREIRPSLDHAVLFDLNRFDGDLKVDGYEPTMITVVLQRARYVQHPEYESRYWLEVLYSPVEKGPGVRFYPPFLALDAHRGGLVKISGPPDFLFPLTGYPDGQ